MTPPSTSTMAPVIQLDLSDSRNDTAFAMSSGLPTGRTRAFPAPAGD
jgi:hypothetical protein